MQAQLAPCGFDIAIDLRKHLDTRPVLKYTGATFLAGYDHENQFPWLDFSLEWEGDPLYQNKRQHISVDLLTLVDAVANGCEEERQVLDPPASDASHPLPAKVAKVAKQLFARPVVCVHPSAGSELRQWPTEYFSQLIDLLVGRLDVHVAIIGGPDEAALCKTVLGAVKRKEAVWSLVGAFKLDELPRVLNACALFVGNNSGPKHIAAGLGVPTVAVHS